MNITIIGSGYVGLVSAACFADVGNRVLCLDVDEHRIALLQRGILPIHEPGLESLVVRNLQARRLCFSSSYVQALAEPQVIFLAVGTPADDDGSANLRDLLGAARSIGQGLGHGVVVANKSTVPVGTAERVRDTIQAELRLRGLDLAVNVVSNPEFLKEGAAILDFMKPDRIVVGSDDAEARCLMRQLYAPFSRNHEKFIEMDVRSAELTKYAANAMLATRISVMNELANLSEAVGADIELVRPGIGLDARIGPQFLYAGAGYGGSCLSKDMQALIRTAAAFDLRLHMLSAAELVNERQKKRLFAKLCRFFGGASRLAGRSVAVWGLAFKPGTDDMRDAPSLALIRALFAAGAGVRAYDPVASSQAVRILQAEYGVPFCSARLAIASSAMEAADGADALVLVTEWQELRAPDFHLLARTLRGKAVFDGRNIYDPASVAAAGLHYEGIGRPSADGPQRHAGAQAA
ncbi:MAG: UDP-glucose dehydrogenase family protein [Gammaproteobacteria bacterium]